MRIPKQSKHCKCTCVVLRGTSLTTSHPSAGSVQDGMTLRMAGETSRMKFTLFARAEEEGSCHSMNSAHVTPPVSEYVLSVQPSVKHLEELEGCSGG